MLPSLARLLWLSPDSPISPQEQSWFFQRIIPDVRHLVYLELFGSRSVRVIRRRREDHCVFHYFTCGRSRNVPLHSTCPDIDDVRCRLPTNLLYTCRLAYLEGMKVLFGSNTLIFPNECNFIVFQATTASYVPYPIRSVDIYISCRPTHNYRLPIICYLLSRKGDIKVRMRWDMDLHVDDEAFAKKEVTDPLCNMMESPGIRATFCMPKNLQEVVRPALTPEACRRVEFTEMVESQPDDGKGGSEDDGEDDSDGSDSGPGNDSEDESEGEDESQD